MSAQHTPGPLRARRSVEAGELIEWEVVRDVGDGQLVVAMTFGGTGPEGHEENADANARRIAACWNACERIPTDMLETIAGLMPATVPYHQLHAQHRDLLAALEEAREGLKWYQDRYPEAVDGNDDEAMARIDAALANVKGPQADAPCAPEDHPLKDSGWFGMPATGGVE